MGRKREHDCCEQTQGKQPCKSPALREIDPDGKWRCGKHSRDPERVAVRRAKALADQRKHAAKTRLKQRFAAEGKEVSPAELEAMVAAAPQVEHAVHQPGDVGAWIDGIDEDPEYEWDATAEGIGRRIRRTGLAAARQWVTAAVANALNAQSNLAVKNLANRDKSAQVGTVVHFQEVGSREEAQAVFEANLPTDEAMQ